MGRGDNLNPFNITKVSIIVPCRNEAGYIKAFFESIANQITEGLCLEVLIADGMSDDGTRSIIQKNSEKDRRVKIIDNPGRIVSTGLNQAILQAQGEIIIRMDVHTEYAPDYIQQCVKSLKETKADNVGGPWRAVGNRYLQKAIALAFQSPFSSGGAGSHATTKEGPVDSVYLGCWRKETLKKIGLFDEELVRNQDDELNLRIIKSGGKIYQSPKIKSYYYPRSSLAKLFKQYMQYGYWKVRVIQKHKRVASLRHIIPGGFVAALLTLGVFSLFSSFAAYALLFLLALYGLANVSASVLTCYKGKNFKYLPVMPLIFCVYHLGYGYGFLNGVKNFIFLKKAGSVKFSGLTRDV